MADSRNPLFGTDLTRIGDFTTGLQFERVDRFIDLTPRIETPNVVREGFRVPIPALDVSRSQFLLDDLVILPPRDQPRVLGQSIRPGTLVPRGTAVDLTLAPPSVIMFDIFEAPHADLLGKPVTEVTEGLLQNSQVREALLRFESPADVPAADKTMLINAFRGANVQVDDAAGGNKGFDAAFNSIRGALAFR